MFPANGMNRVVRRSLRRLKLRAADTTGECDRVGDGDENPTMTNRQHSSKAFLELLEPVRDALHRHARRAVWLDDQVADVLQEAIMTAWREFRRFEIGTNFRAWTFQILINTVYRFNKRMARQKEVGLDDAPLDSYAALEREETWSSLVHKPEMLRQLLDDRLVQSLDRLGSDERQCLLLRLLDGFSYKEIGTMLNMPLGTAMSHVHRARMKLREELASLAVEQGLIREAV